MRMSLIAGLALCLAGCNGMGANDTALNNSAPVVTSSPIVAQTTIDAAKLDAEKALATAENIYNVPAHAYVVADFNKQLSADNKAKLKPWLVSLNAALLKVRDAKTKFDTVVAIGESVNDASAVLKGALDNMKLVNAAKPVAIPGEAK